MLSVEDYLHGVITMVNELVRSSLGLYQCSNRMFKASIQSRFAVNAVTLGDFEAPIKISIFVKDLFAGKL